MSLDARRLAAAGAAILAGIALGCLPWPRPGRVAVLAFEGLDPRAIDLLLAEGRLPSFARLRREGAYGRLEISSPREAALLWRTATTGRLPGPPPRSDEEADSPRRTGPLALWNILSMTGRKVVVVGGPGTSPVEPVVGVMVSEQLLADRVGDTVCCPDGLTYPPDLQTTLQLLVRPSSRATGPEGPARVDDDLELVSCAGSSLTETSDSGEYFVGGFGPHEGLGAFVVDLDVPVEVPFKSPDAFVS